MTKDQLRYAEVDKPQHECAVFGAYGVHAPVVEMTAIALHHMTHRGQEGAGGAFVTQDGAIVVYKESGLARDVFTAQKVAEINEVNPVIALGHARYSTSGSKDAWQPYLRGGAALVCNGNDVNALSMYEKLSPELRIGVSSDTDIQSRRLQMHIDETGDVLEGCRRLGRECEGAANFVIATHGKLIAMRDPWGFHPLSIGVNGQEIAPQDQTWVIASEPSAYISPLQMKYLRDVYPGEGVVIDETGLHTFYMDERAKDMVPAQCIFELIYFASPDAIIFGEHVGTIREKLGRALARRDIEEGDPIPDIIVPVQQSGTLHAQGYAKEWIEHVCTHYNELGISEHDLGEIVSRLHTQTALIRNPYSSRTFIDPGDKRLANAGKHRADALMLGDMNAHTWCSDDVAQMLEQNSYQSNPNKRTVIVDDSIVKGNAQVVIQEMMARVGATDIHVRIASPPIRYPCFMGVDFAEQEKLVAFHAGDTDVEDYVAEETGVASLRYVPPLKTLEVVMGTDWLHEYLARETVRITDPDSFNHKDIGLAYGESPYCGACFHGNYPVDHRGVLPKNFS